VLPRKPMQASGNFNHNLHSAARPQPKRFNPFTISERDWFVKT
jgi:hypothetical protein